MGMLAPVHPRAASPSYTLLANQTFTATGLGPSANQSCPISYDLYLPDPPGPNRSAPAILTTNGFGGSKADQAGIGRFFAPQGYVVLSYSGLGFGGSGCNIELDSPEWDGRAATQLITLLASRPEVMLDAPNDPRVGMIGGSYGGAIQLVTASLDPRLDTIIPVITWNDLAYSLVPNNNSPPFRWSDAPPGVPKLIWTEAFFGLGASQPLQNITTTPVPPSTCPGFDPTVCTANLSTIAQGYANPSTIALLRHNSMVSYGSTVRIPTMLMQGEGDTLFNIDEAIANRQQIMGNGGYVKLVLQSWGHSASTPAPGEYSTDPTKKAYERDLVQNWFDHFLKGLSVGTGPNVEYFRDWVNYDHNDLVSSAAPAYAGASSWPVGASSTFDLSGTSQLVPAGATVQAGAPTFIFPAAPSSYSETSAVQGMQPFSSIPPSDPPLGSVSYTTAALNGALDQVGPPTATLRLSNSIPASVYTADPSLEPQIFIKLYDVAPGGAVTLVERLVSPVKFSDLSQPVTVTLPAIVHHYDMGHQIRFTVTTTDTAYAPARLASVYSLATDQQNPSLITLPTAASSSGQQPAPAAPAAPAALPNTAAGLDPSSLEPGAVALLAALLATYAGRRRRPGVPASGSARVKPSSGACSKSDPDRQPCIPAESSGPNP